MKTRRQSTEPSPIAFALRTLFGRAVREGLTVQMTSEMAQVAPRKSMKEILYRPSRRTGFKERWAGSLFVIAAAALGLFWAQMAQAQTHTIIKDFGILSKVAGLNPRTPLVQGPDGTLYGTTYKGDSYGTVFKIQPDGTGFSVVKCFTNSVEGANPQCGLVLSGSTLYGTTANGGSSGYGTVFKVNTDGTAYTVLKNFTGSDGSSPQAGLVLSGGTLYGTTRGGNSDYGTVFKVNTDGTGFAVLKSFTSSDGSHPYAGLVLSGSTLYGTTAYGGSSGYGTVFKVNTDGTGFAVLKSFTGSDGRLPYADLVLSGGTLYGTTCMGGTSGDGTVFKVNTDGTGFAVLKSFTGSDGSGPWAGVVLSAARFTARRSLAAVRITGRCSR